MKEPSNKRLKLDTWRDVERRIPFIIRFFSTDYTVRLIGKRRLDPKRLFSTESGLESDKLGIVLKAMLYEGYEAPVVVILGYMGRLYIFDGHHRSKVSLWLRRYVDAYLIEARSYKPRITVPLKSTPIINPPTTPQDPVIATWKHMVNIIGFLETRHKSIARLWRERIRVDKLIATQQLIKPAVKVYDTKTPPILVYKYKGKYYVIDGHTRVCAALSSGIAEVEAVVFTLNKLIGIVKTSRCLGEPKFTNQYCHGETSR